MSIADKEVLNPEKKKEYNEMMKHFRKLLFDDVKNACPSDWEFGLNLFIDFLKWMQAYYKLDYNVWALERKDEDPESYKDVPTREQSITETLMYYNRWQSCEGDYYKVAYNDDEVKHYQELGFHLSTSDSTMNEAVNKVNGRVLTLYEDEKKNLDECIKAKEDYKHKFFECLEKYIEEWWD